jgi:hypothetical protein
MAAAQGDFTLHHLATLQRRSHLRSVALHARMTLRSFMVLCSGDIWSVGCAHAICTCAHAFKHATTLAVGAAPASTSIPTYIMQAHRAISAQLRLVMPNLPNWLFGRHTEDQ